jgi:hypothetical protein
MPVLFALAVWLLSVGSLSAALDDVRLDADYPGDRAVADL